jgi:uncharacterized protein (TIGR02172 family)
MDKNLGIPQAVGRTAEIFPWNHGEVLKLFFNWYAIEAIEYEAMIARVVHASGLPVPAAGEIIQVNGRTGLIYQRVDGVVMAKMLGREPWRLKYYADKMAELHAQMHSTSLQVDLPEQHTRLAQKIQEARSLPDSLRASCLAALDAMPRGRRICHGDFHPENIMHTHQSDVIIDWVDATRGNPLADLARTSIILTEDFDGPKGRNSLEKLFMRNFHKEYLQHYFSLCPGGQDEYLRWFPIVAAARVSENIVKVEPWLIAQAAKINQPPGV